MGVQLPSEPITRKEQYLAKAAGQAVEIPAEPITREEAYLDAIAKGSGGGGTSDYSQLTNKPQINGTTLVGNKSASDLSLASTADLAGKVDKVEGKGLSTNDYDDTEKAAVSAATTAIAGIKDGTDIDSFADVETALAGKQGTITAGLYIQKSGDTISVKRDVSEDVDEVLTLTHDTSGGTNKINAVLTVGGETIDSETFTTSGGTFHDLVQIYFNGQAVRFKFKYLVASKTQSAGYENYIYNEYTDTFVETIGEENKLIIKSELDDALSGKQDTLTFDDTPTDNSNNPVKSNGIYDALAVKQDATDNSLETEAKTIVGAINEHEGDIGTLKSGLTNLDNEVNGDSTTYPYADVITIPDAIPANLADCSVKIEPVQDLHGYDHPWVGGAGKNKLPLVLADLKTINTSGTWDGNVYTFRDITYTVVTDDADNVIAIKASGENTSGDNSLFHFCSVTTLNQLLSGTYIMSGCPANGSDSTYRIYIGSSFYDVGAGVEFTTPATGTNCGIAIYNGYTIPTGGLLFKPMIRLSTEQDATFAPYTNVCPISGYTEASVETEGKNIVNPTGVNGTADTLTFTKHTDGTWLVTASGATSALTGYKLGEVTLKSGVEYVLIGCPSGGGANSYRIDLRKSESSIYNNVADNGNGRTFTADEDITLDVYARFVSNYTVPSGGLTFQPMVCRSSETSTTYVPYVAPHTATIAFGDTIYGGTVDFDSGVMTVTHAIEDLGSLNWVYRGDTRIGLFSSEDITDYKLTSDVSAILSCYKYTGTVQGVSQMSNKDNGVARLFVKSDSTSHYLYVINETYSDATAFKTAMNGQKICYELATPFTVQLTPQQIQLLKGQNTLTASTGQISVTVNGVSGSIGAVQEQVNATDEALADLAEKLPTAPTTDGAYVLTVTVADGTPTYSWESAT